MNRDLWKTLTHTLRSEAAYCEKISPLYTRIFKTFLAWSSVIRGGEATVPTHVSNFRDLIESCWRDRTFHYEFESALLLSATVHRLVLGGEAPRVAAFFETVGGHFDEARNGEALSAALAGLFDELPARIEATLSDQRLQTNELSRGVAWLAPFAALQRARPRPTALAELGCSAGFNLLSDRYGWDIELDGTPLVLNSRSRVRTAQTWTSPEGGTGLREAASDLGTFSTRIQRRVGCDLAVSDLTDATDLNRLAACVWGDNPTKFARLRNAVAALTQEDTAREVQRFPVDLLTFVKQDLRKVAAIGDGTMLLLFNSVVTCYLSHEDYAELRRLVTSLFQSLEPRSTCYWIELEPPRDDESLDSLPVGAPTEAVVRLHRLRDGGLEATLLGGTQMHPQHVVWGTEMDQLAAEHGSGA